MHANVALSEELRQAAFPHSRLKGRANLLIMPNIDAANIASNLVLATGNELRVSVGPILLGAAYPAHILVSTVTARGIVNMTAVAVVDAQNFEAARAQKALPFEKDE